MRVKERDACKKTKCWNYVLNQVGTWYIHPVIYFLVLCPARWSFTRVSKYYLY